MKTNEIPRTSVYHVDAETGIINEVAINDFMREHPAETAKRIVAFSVLGGVGFDSDARHAPTDDDDRAGDSESQFLAIEAEIAEEDEALGGWTIDTDHLNTDEDGALQRANGFLSDYNNSRVGVGNVLGHKINRDTPHALRFHLFDDDDNLYYSGWLVEPEDGDPELCPWLSAMNFGARDAGCTYITGADKSKPVIA